MRGAEGRQKPAASRLWKTPAAVSLFRLVAASAAMGYCLMGARDIGIDNIQSLYVHWLLRGFT